MKKFMYKKVIDITLFCDWEDRHENYLWALGVNNLAVGFFPSCCTVNITWGFPKLIELGVHILKFWEPYKDYLLLGQEQQSLSRPTPSSLSTHADLMTSWCSLLMTKRVNLESEKTLVNGVWHSAYMFIWKRLSTSSPSFPYGISKNLSLQFSLSTAVILLTI